MVTPLLIDITPADLSGPLAQFQATAISKEDMLRLAKDISAGLPGKSGEAIVDRSFEKWWPDLPKDIATIVESIEPNRRRTDARKDRELLEELLQISRGLSQHFSFQTSPPLEYKATEVSPTSGDAGTILDFMKVRLEKDRKMRLLSALDKAAEVYIDGAILCIDYEPRNYYLQEVVARADNVTLLRELCQQASGRAMGIRVKTKEAESETAV